MDGPNRRVVEMAADDHESLPTVLAESHLISLALPGTLMTAALAMTT